MNGKTIKKLQRIARQLPKTVEVVKVRDVVLKSALTPDEQKKVELIPGDYVHRTRDKLVELDHIKKLKTYYKKHGGEKFLEEYMRWLVPYHLKIQKQFPHLVEQAAQPAT